MTQISELHKPADQKAPWKLAALEALLKSELGSPPRVTAAHLQSLAPQISAATVQSIIAEVLADEALLALVANRSYTHSLGFRKITLLDCGFTLRLHIWNPELSTGAVPLVESKHEHSFDFVSRILYGGMETQCYRKETITSLQMVYLRALLKRLEKLSEEERKEASCLIAALETTSLTALGSKQAAAEGVSCDLQRRGKLLKVSAKKLATIVNLQGVYQYDMQKSVFGGEYFHRLVEYVHLTPLMVVKLEAGDLYFHGHEYAHRLYMPAVQPNATLVLTSQVSDKAIGASFQHPTYYSGEDVGYARRMYTMEEMRETLKAFKARLEALSVPTNDKAVDLSEFAPQGSK